MTTLKEIYSDLIDTDAYWRGNPGKRPEVQRQVVMWLKKIKATTVLDAGCGRGDLGLYLRQSVFKVKGCDLADASKYCKIPFDQASILEMPYTDDQFDAVVCVDVIEHLHPEDVDNAVREMLRVGKHLIIHAACYESHHGPYRELHLTIETPDEWLKRWWPIGTILKTNNIERFNQKKNVTRKTICALIGPKDEQ